jgi:hypothetical protein
MSMKNSNDNMGNRTRDLPTCSAVPQPTALPRAPNGTIRRTIFRKVRTETILKLYNTLVLPTFLYGSENWTLTALQRRRIEAAEMQLLRPLAGYTLYDYKTNDSVHRELQTECILDKIYEYRRNWFLHLQKMPQNRISLKSYHYRPQGRRTIGRPKKRWREQFWRRNGSKGPILDVYDDDV